LSPELFEKKKELRKTPEEAAELVLSLFEANGAHGVTVSGGEPFERPLGLKKFLEIIKKNGVDDALIYSGYLASELLLSFPWLKELATALVDGPFKENEPSKEIFRGSMGQTLTVFDPRKKDLYEDWSKQTKRKAQFVLVGREIRVLGVPARGELEKAFAKALDPEKPLIFK
jgi:anaerobic ribonucleoside-triphosphate reductase activating protein